jgi:uncharacterized protein (TIGR03790 family)
MKRGRSRFQHNAAQREVLWIAAVLGLSLTASADAGEARLQLPQTGLGARQLAVIVNESDPVSARIAEYYRARRGIPAENVVRVRFPAEGSNLSRDRFRSVRAEVERRTPPHIQAYALAWTKPYRVDCMSITSAFALGFDEAYCAKSCGTTKPSGYFNSPSHAPYTDHRIRPAMMLAGGTLRDVRKLIDRGMAADFTYPAATGYLLNTTDKNRSVRAVFFNGIMKVLGRAFSLQRLDTDSIKDKKDVLFYFTGLANVPDLPSLRFVPGAVADHLTSAGGQLTDSGQMSSLRWLEAGATGSYGAVVEPCNHLAKFPHPAVVMWRYAEGNSLIEAYWKSVAWPGQGVFIGEPLAKPFAPRVIKVGKDHVRLKVFSPGTKNLSVETATSAIGPYRPAATYPVKPGLNDIEIHLPDTEASYRVAD